SLVYNWTAEFERFAPELSVVAVAGGAQERRAARLEAFGGHRRVDVLVTSYDLLRIDIDDWSSHRLFICALDEAQYIKNPAALTTRAVKSLEADHKFALTGTPMENRLSELWSIFDFLMPGLLGPYARFRERFESPIVGGDDAVARRLQAIVAPFMLRRLKADVLTDLPDKLESVVYANMDVEQRKLYDAHEQRLREELTAQRMFRKEREAARAAGKPVSTVEVLAEITRLRQLCCDPRLVYEDYRGPSAKLDAIVDLVSSAVEGGEKTLVFSQFTSFLELIAERLRKAGIAHYSITGATPKKERVRLVDAFNEDDTPAFLVSLKAGGTGLNLTGASVVIHADPWWNAAAQSQATDRAHRIGQTRVVSVEKVVAKNTIEERIVRLQQTKSELADQVVGAGGISLASLDADDLYELLQG
ncbi:MAG: DEAD/DEAH box helicase, partial [Slackia isoflavoniconvertens]|nr:DEAD/DEAH box helicase [Slackia isoflavoniconvertens]